MSVSAEQIVEACNASVVPSPDTLAPGMVGAPAVPAWLASIAAEAVAKFGPEVLALLRDKAAPALIDYITGKFHVTPKA